MPNTALIIVDVQNDFLPGGALGVPDGDKIIEPILEAAKNVDLVAFTRDFHPADHISFSEEPKFEDKSWPAHCVQGTRGVMIHRALDQTLWHAPVFSKGTDRNVEQYSGARAVDSFGTALGDWLEENDVREIAVVGLALDYCVKATAIDLAEGGFDVAIALDATRPVAWETGAEALLEIADADVGVTTVREIREFVKD